MISVAPTVKEALRDGRYSKSYSFYVLNDDESTDFTIDNDDLVSESVKFDERMCSDDTLKFGLCEGTSLEFQYFGKENILGRRIRASAYIEYKVDADVTVIQFTSLSPTGSYTVVKNNTFKLTIGRNAYCEYTYTHLGVPETVSMTPSSETTISFDCIVGDTFEITCTSGLLSQPGKSSRYQSIPMGYYDVAKCPRQASTGIYKVTAYNKLMSDYFDSKANLLLANSYTTDATLYVYDIIKCLLGDYKIDQDKTELTPYYDAMTSTESNVSLGTFQFSYKYGVASPFNAYRAGIEAGVNFTLTMYTYYKDYLSPQTGYIEVGALYGNLVQFEQNVVNYIKNLIDSAELNRTGEEVIEYICANSGFQYVFGVQVGNSWYSTVQYEYEEEHGITHTVAGNISDVANKLQYQSIYTAYQVRYPRYIMSGGNSNTYTVYFKKESYSYYKNSSLTISTGTTNALTFSDGTDFYSNNTKAIVLYVIEPTDEELLTFKISEMPDFTLRQLQAAVYELQCKYGKLDRSSDLFAGISLSLPSLYPADTLYPSNTLYPTGNAERSVKSLYSKLWYDDQGVQTFRNLIITYKDSDGNNKLLTTTINEDGTTDYICDDNWLFLNLNWSESDVQTYADAMVTEMQNISWFPFEMWCAGLPYVEAGDMIEIVNADGESNTSYVLQRQLQGIQNLQDTYINGTLDVF